ncbi:YfjP family GTPase [Streptomyces sp. NPDC059766]|uniref:YfjP family GTPase n=1 Tax=Streptomyces sp. NPDC059766 TaxID=3346940 RepID=UPI003646E9BA
MSDAVGHERFEERVRREEREERMRPGGHVGRDALDERDGRGGEADRMDHMDHMDSAGRTGRAGRFNRMDHLIDVIHVDHVDHVDHVNHVAPAGHGGAADHGDRRDPSDPGGPERPEDRLDGQDRQDRTGHAGSAGRVDRVDGKERAEYTEHAERADRGESTGAWDDGLIARRVTEEAAATAPAAAAAVESRAQSAQIPAPLAYDGPLRSRLDALRELVGLSRARLDNRTLAEAGRVLDESAARRRLSGQHTVVAIAGATGSGKSQLFNVLAGVTISETGVRRPTTAAPIVCSWSDGASGLIDRLGIPGRLRRRPLQSAEAEALLGGLVLVDLPDHDSAAVQHREQVDRVLALVDAVIWVVDPEKYADAVLHERYLRPMAGHAEVMFVVLNQIDRLPEEAADLVLDDLRRLLDEDGIALGEYDEPGATVLALSALTGDGVGELREALGQFVAERGAAARRISADVDAAAVGLRPVYATGRRSGLSEEARDEFTARLADAVGAAAAGEAAERAWLRNANRACGTPWLRLWRWFQDRGAQAPAGRLGQRAQADEEATARQRVEQAVRGVSERASAGLPTPWAQTVREAAVRGSQGLSEALDELAARAGLPPGRPPRPGWWPLAVLAQAAMTLLQIVGGLWLVGQIAGVMAPNLGVPVLLMLAGIVGGPLIEWSCRMAARGPAKRYGLEAERRLREAAAGCGRARVLDPVAAELLRYREVREQYGRVVGAGAGVR